MTEIRELSSALSAAESLFATRYKGAEFCVASGSIIQGCGLQHSDLDLIVVYPKVLTAYRESFFHSSMPVEAFVHDFETIQAFMDDDLKAGNASMQHMLATGKIVPYDTEAAIKLKRYAQEVLAKGLPATSQETMVSLQYRVSDLIDDLKDSRPIGEHRATLYSLYHAICELKLRQSGHFIAAGKHLARKIKNCDLVFSEKLEGLIESAHASNMRHEIIERLLALVAPLGCPVFDGYKQDAPVEMRTKARWFDSRTNG